MEQRNSKKIISGEAALLIMILINSLGVDLMLHSGSGISAISSVPYSLSEAYPIFTLGQWTYLFQGVLVLSLMAFRKKFIPQYILSFGVGFAFSMMLDIHEKWIQYLPQTLFLRILYFCLSYFLICLGIALSNRCGLPIAPTDLFPKELSDITKIVYSKIKISYDISCLAVTAVITFLCFGHIKGLGVGTVIAAFTMGKAIGLIGEVLDQHFMFISWLKEKHNAYAGGITVKGTLF